MSMRVLTAALVGLMVTACGSVSAGPRAGVAATPCVDGAGASPYAHTEGEQSVAVPRDGEELSITVRVGEQFTVGWPACAEHGELTTEANATGSVRSTDVSVYSSPRPQRSGDPCCQRPVGDGVFNVRYMAETAGQVTLRGKGSAGTDGTIAVTIESLSPSPHASLSKLTPVAGPPTGPCIFPTSPELAELRGASTSVVEGTVAAAVPDSNGSFTHFDVSDVRTLVRTAPSSLTLTETGGVPVPLLQPGRFVLFLEQTTIKGQYYVVNGKLGAFEIDKGLVNRYCANYVDPASPIPAQGNGVPLASFEAMIQSQRDATHTPK